MAGHVCSSLISNKLTLEVCKQ